MCLGLLVTKTFLGIFDDFTILGMYECTYLLLKNHVIISGKCQHKIGILTNSVHLTFDLLSMNFVAA